MKLYISGLFFLISSSLVLAQNQKQTIDSTKQKTTHLNEVIITGNKLTDPVLSVAHKDHVKRVVQPRNVADVFDGVNGFSLIKRGNYAIDPSFRAAQYEQLNLQFDGGTKIMHACPNRMDPITTHVIPEDIEKIEVIKGPYTVRYGATFGGVVNLVTKRGTDLKEGLHGAISTSGESNGTSSVSQLTLSQKGDNYNVMLSGGYRDFGNYKDGNDTEIPSSFRSLDYGIRTNFEISNSQHVQLNWKQSFGRDVLHAGLPMDTEYDNSSLLSLDYDIKPNGNVLKTINTKVYYAYVDHLMTNTLRPSFNRVEAKSGVDATTIGGKVEFHLKPTNKWNLFTGIDAVSIARDGDRNRLVKRNMMGDLLPQPMAFTDKIWQDSQLNDYGIFIENKYTFSSKTIATLGLRTDIVSSDINDPEANFLVYYPDAGQRTETNVSATLSAKHRISEHLMLEAAFGRGVRSANMIERFINHFTVGQDRYEYLGNPNLDAEVNNQFELGIKGDTKLFSLPVNFSTSVYYSKYNNYIVPVIDPNLTRRFMPNAQPQEVKRFVNLDDAYKTGFEIDITIALSKSFNFGSAMSYVYTKNQDLNESLPLTPPLMTRFELGYEKNNYWATLDYQLTASQNELATSFGETKTQGYEVLSLRLGTKLFKHLDIGLACLNIFDVAYNNHLNFSFTNQADFSRVPINDPGRNFSMFVKYSF